MPNPADRTSARVTFADAAALAAALRRAADAHHAHETRTGASDPDWAAWYADHIASEQAQITEEPPMAQDPTFSADILPKFRRDDIGCMRPMGVRLADPEWMTDPGGDADHPDHANARRVFARLRSGRMPPDGAWPEGWLATYEAWMAAGFAP